MKGDKKKEIKIAFVDFGGNPNGIIKYWLSILNKRYRVVLSDKPDYLFYSVFGNTHHDYDCVKICFTGENVVPNFNYCDYAFGFHYITFEDRYMRLPLWCLHAEDLNKALARKNLPPREALNRRFCAQVVSNAKITNGVRETFFEKLNAYKTIDSGGRYNNTVGGPVKNKEAFLKKYKFSLAFENTSAHGYCTEKLLQAYAYGTVPIYYGDETAVRDFNPKAFINVNDFKTLDEAVAFIEKIDKDDEAYLKMYKEPLFKKNRCPSQYSADNVAKFLDGIFSKPLDKARFQNNARHFADIDCTHMKKRDVYKTLRAYAKRTVLKWVKK